MVMSLDVKYYTRPNGRISWIKMKNIDLEDAEFFKVNNLEVSMEDLMTGEIVVYSTTPVMDDEGEPIEELVIISPEETTSHEAMKKLRKLVEKYYND